jgi:serine/threonine protein phosphatase PrpC
MVGGSCASILVIENENYYVANVGDSRIVKSSFLKGKMMIDQITTDHKPENPI